MTETARTLGPDRPGQRLQPDRVVRELYSLATTLNAAFDRLDEAIRQQRRFTADASHELRTPAAILLSNAQLMLRRARSADEYRAGLRTQLATARRLAALVDTGASALILRRSGERIVNPAA